MPTIAHVDHEPVGWLPHAELVPEPLSAAMANPTITVLQVSDEAMEELCDNHHVLRKF